MYIDVPCGEKMCRILLKDVLCVPDIGVTLVFISCVTATRCYVVFQDNSCFLYSKEKALVGEIEVSGGLYCVYHPREYAARVTKLVSLHELHCRLGHINYDII